MRAIYGQNLKGLSPTVGLQSFLDSKLPHALDGIGSPEYALTWKQWAMKSGQPICAQRASARRTSGKGSTGWPTTRANDGTGAKVPPGRMGGPALKTVAGWATTTTTRDYRYPNKKSYRERGGGAKGEQLNNQVVHQVGWPTPNVNEQGEALETVLARKARCKARGVRTPGLMKLGTVVQLASWPTPSKSDGEGGILPPSGTSSTGRRPDGKKAQMGLNTIARLSQGWNTPRATDVSNGGPNQAGGSLSHDAHGSRASSPHAKTGKAAALVLNPHFSRWLMGLPAEWDACAATETPSSRRSRPTSSKR